MDANSLLLIGSFLLGLLVGAALLTYWVSRGFANVGNFKKNPLTPAQFRDQASVVSVLKGKPLSPTASEKEDALRELDEKIVVLRADAEKGNWDKETRFEEQIILVQYCLIALQNRLAEMERDRDWAIYREVSNLKLSSSLHKASEMLNVVGHPSPGCHHGFVDDAKCFIDELRQWDESETRRV